jgi:NAD(P)-dependent dehydrogenase (short-subunit alcohol dehydrogenase family)
MDDFRGKVAVITGAASGFGREFARSLAVQGAKLVLADVDEKGMQETIGLLAPGTEAIAVRCDVGAAASLDELADRAYARFGAVHLVFNNAGVAVCGPAWTATLEDWKWVLDINLMGVVHGVRSFLPRMIASGEPGHVVNTASVAGLLSLPGSAVYCVSKHAVVTLSECLRHDLRVAKAPIGVSVLCPAFVQTGIFESARNRPKDLAATNPYGKAYEEAGRKAVAAGKLSAEDIARITLEAVKSDRFYVIPHRKTKGGIETRMRDILDERDPTDISRPVELESTPQQPGRP